MKQKSITDLLAIPSTRIENLFNVYRTGSGHYFYNTNTVVQFPKDIDPSTYTVYSVRPGDTYQKMSFSFYGTIDLWWVICMMNGVQVPILPPPAGTSLRILNPQYIQTILSNAANA